MAAPVADFSFSPAFGKSPLAVQFTDLSTNSPTSWLWTFDRGNGQPPLVRTEQNPLVTLTTGRWAVSLVVSNADGTSSRAITNTQGPFVSAPD